MNGWVIAGSVLIFVAALGGVALWARGEYKRLDEQHAAFNKAADKAEEALKDIVTERDAQAQHIVDLLAENGELQEQLDKAQAREKAAAEQRKIVQEHLDVLSPKPKRTSRAKPPEKEI